MELSDVGAIVIGEIAIFVGLALGIAAMIWQMHLQSGRLEKKIDDQVQRLETKIDAQGQRFEDKLDAQAQRLEAQMQRMEANTNAQVQRMEANANAQMQRMDANANILGQRLSESEREQARLEGVNSVLRRQAHTHEAPVSD